MPDVKKMSLSKLRRVLFYGPYFLHPGTVIFIVVTIETLNFTLPNVAHKTVRNRKNKTTTLWPDLLRRGKCRLLI
jgi:hypothetical protein